MELTYIDGQNLKRFMINGANRLWVNKDKVDAMNVFPVPDKYVCHNDRCCQCDKGC